MFSDPPRECVMQFRFVTSLGSLLWPNGFSASVSGAPTSLSSFCPLIHFEKRRVLFLLVHVQQYSFSVTFRGPASYPTQISSPLRHPATHTSVVTRPLPSSSRTSQMLLRAKGTGAPFTYHESGIFLKGVCNLGTKSQTKKALGERNLTAISQDALG